VFELVAAHHASRAIADICELGYGAGRTSTECGTWAYDPVLVDSIWQTPAPRVTPWADAADAALYELGRPEYPSGLAAVLAEQLSLQPGSRVMDVAAGTGKLTRVLARTPALVTAVELQPAMVGQLRKWVPGVDVVAGRAEYLPVGTGTVDAVTVGQAFHWFRVADASHEFRRILRPGGTLAVISNRRHEPEPWVKDLWSVLGRYEKLAPSPGSNRAWREALDRTGDFTGFDRFELPNEQRFDGLADFDARFTSVSFVILLDSAARASLLRDLHAVVAGIDPIVIPLRTVVEVSRRCR
jgi:SAM-dependent methyltransferase